MKSHNIFKQYTWLVNILHRHKRLTLSEINKHWLNYELSEGIPIARSTFTSDPYRASDWSGKGREVYYMDMDIEDMLHPEKTPLLTPEVLAKEIPDFKWDGGHSGRILTGEQAEKLYMLWNDYLAEL